MKRNPDDEKVGYGSKPGGFTEVDAIVALGSIGAVGFGLATYKPGASSDADQEKNKLATSSIAIGALAGLLLLTTKAEKAIPSK